MKLSTRILAGAIAVGALTVTGLSLAQPGGMGYGPGMGYGMGHGMGWAMGAGMGPGAGNGMGPGGWMSGADATAAIAGRMAAWKSELKITPAQEPAWNAFAEQAQQQFTAMAALRDQMHSQMTGAQAGSTDFVALRDSMFKLRQAGAEAQAAKWKDLAAVLTPEQKALVDQRFGGGWGPGSHHGHF